MKQSEFSLIAVSPIDGRYRKSIEELSDYSSEFALIKYRLLIEVNYLISLSKINVVRKLSSGEIEILKRIVVNFSLKEAEKIKEIEGKTKHDVKSVEYYIKTKLSKTSLSNILDFIHFGLTSEDVNNIAYRLMLKNANTEVMQRALKALADAIFEYAKKNKSLPMLARTHGQGAVPTTLGKELLVFYERLQKEIKTLISFRFSAKLNGAVGNYNALYFSYPKINWGKFSKHFVEDFGFENYRNTTQIAPYEDIIYFFQTIQRINGIVLDLNQDIWRYISDGWFAQELKQKEVGSSTMPQKVNPILFENSEGNLIIANSLIEGFVSKLPISRLQRDLSGSTISRNFGSALAYSLLAYKNCLSGLLRINPNEVEIRKVLNDDWSVLSEAIQIYLKKNGIKNGYEKIKEQTRGQEMTNEDFLNMIEKLPLNENQKKELKKLTPEKYIGIIY